MAIYHCSVKIIGRSSGRSSVASSAYRSAEKLHTNAVASASYRSGTELHSESDGITHDYTRKRGVVYNEIILPVNAPEEFAKRNVLWNAVEKSEKRKDAQTAREVELALPIELALQEQKELLRGYIKENFVSVGMCADYAIHDKKDGNPHAHIMLTTRDVSKSGFGNKNREWNDKAYLEKWRENWAKACNEKLHKKGLDVRIDHRTLEAQGIELEPTIHVGRSPIRAKINLEIIERNKRYAPHAVAEYMNELQEGFTIVDNHLTECNQMKRELDRLNHFIGNMEKDAREIEKIQAELKEALAEREEMILSFWQTAKNKAINERINNLTNSEQYIRDYFVRSFNIQPEAAPDEILRIKTQADFLNKNIALASTDKFIEVRNSIIIEYQKQLLKAEIRPDGKEILEKIKQPQFIQLSRINNENFNKIVNELNPLHAKILMENRKKSRVRAYERLR